MAHVLLYHFGMKHLICFCAVLSFVGFIPKSSARSQTGLSKRTDQPYRIEKENSAGQKRVNPNDRRVASTPTNAQYYQAQQGQDDGLMEMMMMMGIMSALGGSSGGSFAGTSGLPGSQSGAGLQTPSISAGSCQSVAVDCKSHTITLTLKDGKTIKDKVNCGLPGNPRCKGGGTTATTNGKVGGQHSGTIVPVGVDIQAPGMGQSAGGKVFHSPGPSKQKCNTYPNCAWGSGRPSGTNTTCGCIALSQQMMSNVALCKGAPLSIVGTDGRSSPRGKPVIQQAHAGRRAN